MKTLAATIENDQEREQLLAQIRGLIALQDRVSPAALDRPFSQRLVEPVSNAMEKFSMALQSLDGFIPDGKTVSAWVRNNLSDPQNVMRSSRRALPIILILLLAWVAEFSAIRLSARYLKRIEDRARQNHSTPVGPAFARTAWRLFAPAVFVIVALMGFVFVRPEVFGLKIALQAIAVYVAGRMFIIMARMVLAPESPALRLAPLKSDSARSLFLWIRRLVLVALSGYLMVGTGRLLGMTVTATSILLDGLAFALLFMIIVCILGNRARVAAWLRGSDQDPTPSLSACRRIRRSLAGVWHILAIVYLVAAFGVWWLDVTGGFIYLARGTVLSGLVLFVVRIAINATRNRIVENITASQKIARKFPIVAQRLTRYAPIVFLLIRSAIVLVAAAAILGAWEVDAHRWLAGAHAMRFLGFFFSMLLVAIIAAVTWEAVNIATEHYLAKSEKPDATPTHGARLRTLLPLIRKALMIVLSVMIVMIVLSEFGVNIGPLLAGAGIIGLAVGFGAQKLVQDIITGVFILLEDAVAVGDVVKVAGIGGLVEGLSIRSIRLRDLAGNVHTIPFSSVETVTNMTRMFSYYLADIGVAYREDTDQVAEVCRGIVEEMRSEPEFAADILEPLEVLGVDQFADSAVILKARIKTQPIRQWAVGREFNRRMKKRFDELGIEIPFPHRTIYFGAGKDGGAPPVHINSEPKMNKVESERNADECTEPSGRH
ncbi:MAG: mechanosensitive ion channel [Desulfobacterales bacterium]